MTRDPELLLVQKLKKKSAEVSLQKVTKKQREGFRGAQDVEIKRWLETESCRAALVHVPSERIMCMRWVFIYKPIDPNNPEACQKPKARSVILGFQDPGRRSTPQLLP